jgi:hypothetical protein
VLVIKYNALVWRYLIVIVILLSYLTAENINTRVCHNFCYSERLFFKFQVTCKTVTVVYWLCALSNYAKILIYLF